MSKKAEAEKEMVMLGRPKNNLESGIVGLANVGKSTLFQAMTKTTLGNPANFPYATIEPEEARLIVPDERYDWLCEQYKPKSRVPANLTIYDIAGLTKGASTGAGLGNVFLDKIRSVDAIYQVVRCFKDPEIIHVEGDVDPARDVKIISDELRFKDIEFATKALEPLKAQIGKTKDKMKENRVKDEIVVVEKVLQVLNGVEGDEDNNPPREVRKFPWTAFEVEVINSLRLLTAKPIVYLMNISEADFVAGKFNSAGKVANALKETADKEAKLFEKESTKKSPKTTTKFVQDPKFPISAAFESKLTAFETEAEVAEEEKKLGAKSTVPKMITFMRNALNLNSFFTTGADEVRQWTIRAGTTAPQAAGVIHGDLQATFIQAVVYNYKVLREEGDEASVRAAGKVMTKGKTYVMEDGDILLVKAGAAKKG